MSGGWLLIRVESDGRAPRGSLEGRARSSAPMRRIRPKCPTVTMLFSRRAKAWGGGSRPRVLAAILISYNQWHHAWKSRRAARHKRVEGRRTRTNLPPWICLLI